MRDFDPLTVMDRAIIAAAEFGGGITIGVAPDAGGYIRRPKSLVFRGLDETYRIEQLIAGQCGSKEARKRLMALLDQLTTKGLF